MAERVPGIISGFNRNESIHEIPGPGDPRKYLLGYTSIKDSLFREIRMIGDYEIERERMVLRTRFRQQTGRDAQGYLSDAIVDLYNSDSSFIVEVLENRMFLVIYNRPSEAGDTRELFSAIVGAEKDGFSITSVTGTHQSDLFERAYRAHVEIGDKLGNIFYQTTENALPNVDCGFTDPSLLYASLPIQ